MSDKARIYAIPKMNKKYIDNKDKKLIMMLQKGIPITIKPYKDISDTLGIGEDELILRLKKLKNIGLVKRIDFRVNLKKIGFVGTLVACRIPHTEIPRAKDIILNCKNVTHNYLRKHKLNMWFTLTAPSSAALSELLTKLKEKLKINKILSLKTKKIFKVGLCLNA